MPVPLCELSFLHCNNRAETERRHINSLLPHLLLLLNKGQIAVIDREIAQSE